MSVRIDPSVWGRVGRLPRATFGAIQEALEVQAEILGREEELPEAGDQKVDGLTIHYEVDTQRRILTLTRIDI